MTITQLSICGTGLSFDRTAPHATGALVDMRPNAVVAAAAVANGKASTYQGNRPRGPEPA